MKLSVHGNHDSRLYLTLPVVDSFLSFQGEGLRMGQLTYFIRLFGCNLQCSFCDEPTHNESNKIITETFEKIVSQVIPYFSSPGFAVCFTGGEPLLHKKNLIKLCKLLVENGVPNIQIETNGTQDFFVSRFLWNKIHVTVAPKKETDFFIHDKLWERDILREIKIVCNAKNCELNVNYVINKYFNRIKENNVAVFIQPENDVNSINFENLRVCVDIALKYNLHISPQLHKLINVS